MKWDVEQCTLKVITTTTSKSRSIDRYGSLVVIMLFSALKVYQKKN